MAASKLLSLDGYNAISRELKKYIDDSIKASTADIVVQKDTYLNFPVVGKPNAVYIDVSDKAVYRWDDAQLKYFKVLEGIDSLKIIDGTAGFKKQQ